MRVPRTFGRAHTHLSKPSQTENSLPMVREMYTPPLASSTHVSGTARLLDVTETSTHRPWKASVTPMKLPATGVT